MKILLKTALVFLLPFASWCQETPPSSKKKVDFTLGGFAKMDVMFTSFEGGEPTQDSPLRDIHLPSGIPIGGKNAFDTHMHIKESRFFVDLKNELLGKPVRVYFEMDFLLSEGGDQRVSNSYNPRIRHFYFDFGNWKFGQTWTTFMVVIIPDDLDFAGAAEGIVFGRQPQVRYTLDKWQFSLELPESTITPNGGGAFQISSGGIPDAVVRRNFNGDWGEAGVAGIARNIRYYDAQENRHGQFGFGVTGGAKINTGERDDIRLSATYGNGLGRYLALAFLNGAVINDAGDLETINSINGYVAYLHHWNAQWRSSFNYSFLQANNPSEYTGLEANNRAWSASANLLYNPAPELLFGVESMYGYRGIESGAGDGFFRVQFSARYAFKYKN